MYTLIEYTAHGQPWANHGSFGLWWEAHQAAVGLPYYKIVEGVVNPGCPRAKRGYSDEPGWLVRKVEELFYDD